MNQIHLRWASCKSEMADVPEIHYRMIILSTSGFWLDSDELFLNYMWGFFSGCLMREAYEREMGNAGRGGTHVAAAPAQLVRKGRKRLEQI